MLKKLVFGLFSLILLSLIVNFSRQTVRLWRSADVLKEKKDELAVLEKKNEELKDELKRIESPEFIEEAAREKLGLGKEGEVVVILPSGDLAAQENYRMDKEPPNWKKWWRLFF